MHFYLRVFNFNFLKELAYPTEIVAFLFRKLINLGFLLLFWYVISSSNTDIFTFKQIISYFLISGAIQDLTLSTGGRFGRDIQKLIKNGSLSNYLIQPIDTLRFLYVSFAGERTSVNVVAFIFLLIGLYIYPPQSIVNILLFIVALVFTTMTGAGINVFLGIVGFYSPEAGSIKNVYEHIKSILSGALVPLTYFPEVIKNIAFFTPFPVLVYFPTSILQEAQLSIDTFTKLGLSAFWGIILLITSNVCWKKALKNYDGVGI